MHSRFSAAGFHNVRSYGWILRFDSFFDVFRTPKHSNYGHSTTLRNWPQFANQACELLAAQAFRLQTSPLGATAWCHMLSHPLMVFWWFMVVHGGSGQSWGHRPFMVSLTGEPTLVYLDRSKAKGLLGYLDEDLVGKGKIPKNGDSTRFFTHLYTVYQ